MRYEAQNYEHCYPLMNSQKSGISFQIQRIDESSGVISRCIASGTGSPGRDKYGDMKGRCDIMKKNTMEASFMKYYLVAILDKESGKIIENSTRNLIKKIKPKKKTSFYGVVLDAVEDPDMPKFEELVREITKPVRRFKIDIVGNLSYDEEFKTIGLDVVNFGYIKRMARNFNSQLSLHGYKVRSEETIENKETVQLILYNGGITKDLESFQSVLKKNQGSIFKIDRFEIWKNFNFKRDSVVTTIPLVDPNIIS